MFVFHHKTLIEQKQLAYLFPLTLIPYIKKITIFVGVCNLWQFCEKKIGGTGLEAKSVPKSIFPFFDP